MKRALLISIFVIAAGAAVADAAGVPETMDYQGVLTDTLGAFVPDGPYDFDFNLYNVDVGGPSLWNEVHVNVQVTLGGFQVILGSGTPLSLDFDEPYWLGIMVDGGAELTPRVELTSTAYSLSTRKLCLPYSDSADNGSGILFQLENTSPTAEAKGIVVKMSAATGNFTRAITAIQTQTGNFGTAIHGEIENGGTSSNGVLGFAPLGAGVRGVSVSGIGVRGISASGIAIDGSSNDSFGVHGTTAGSGPSSFGVAGAMGSLTPHPFSGGVHGIVIGDSTVSNGYGVLGEHLGTGSGVRGLANIGKGVSGHSDNGVGVRGSSSNGLAGAFFGDVEITGNLTKTTGTFKIDHPLDPENKYLSHSFVESPDMLNIYNGTVILDDSGEASVEMPGYFHALNRDFQYQLTAIGAPAPGIYIAQEIVDDKFEIAGGSPGLKVSWQVTGIRQDPAANFYSFTVETDKSPEDRGRYLNPQAFGKPMNLGIHWEPVITGEIETDVAQKSKEEGRGSE